MRLLKRNCTSEGFSYNTFNSVVFCNTTQVLYEFIPDNHNKATIQALSQNEPEDLCQATLIIETRDCQIIERPLPPFVSPGGTTIGLTVEDLLRVSIRCANPEGPSAGICRFNLNISGVMCFCCP